MTYEEFDPLFWTSARKVFGGQQVPYAELFRAAHLGFEEAFGRQTLENHSWLAFLNRLWDSHRTGGLPDGPIRVPDRIWALATADNEQGHLHRELLEATGMRFPQDFGQELDFHLTLWRQEALVGAMRGPGQLETSTVMHAGGPVSLSLVATDTGYHIELRADLPGSYIITLHWSDGSTEAHQTTPLLSGQTYAFDVTRDSGEPGVPVELPQSVHILRKQER